jgi:hypothetical protein
MTKDQLLAALDKPRSTAGLVMIISQGKNTQTRAQRLLLELRDDGLVKFDIKKGLWSRPRSVSASRP